MLVRVQRTEADLIQDLKMNALPLSCGLQVYLVHKKAPPPPRPATEPSVQQEGSEEASTAVHLLLLLYYCQA